jgi:AcrR family transcriptional regulator
MPNGNLKDDRPSRGRSPLQGGRIRAEHAAVTRRVILDGARRVFAERGYSAVTVKQLAASAGVSVQTIYDTFGSKAGVLMAFVELVDVESGILDLVRLMPTVTDPREMLALFARMRRQIRERCGDVIGILRSGAVVDPDVAATLAKGVQRRHLGQRAAMERLESHGHLRSGITSTRAADIAAALTADEVCDALVDQRGWSFDEYEQWLAETLALLLLSPPASKRGATRR